MDKFTVELLAEDIKLIGDLLIEQPFKHVVDLINRLNGQLAQAQAVTQTVADVMNSPTTPQPGATPNETN